MAAGTSYWRVSHARLDAHRFLAPFQRIFTTRGDGTRWPKWRHTWGAANRYLDGFLSQGRSKTMQRMARAVGIPDDALERFIRESPWDYGEVQRWLMGNVPSSLRGPRAALVVDDVALLKQGRHSVGVYRQYAGASGKVDNCQVAVDLTYAVPGENRNADQATWPLGMRLYLPRPWVEEADYEELRREVRLPKDVGFRTKPEIALEMIDEARARGLPHKVILADAGYGDSAEFRKALRDRNEPYALGVTPGNLRVIDADIPVEPPGRGPTGRPRTSARHPAGTRRRSPSQIARGVRAWTRVEWGQGTKGPLVGRFHRTRVRVTVGAAERRHATDEIVWLLLERRSNELKAYLCWGLDGASLEELVAWAHLRWTIEQFHREAKQVLGMDRFEGRTWRGWHHHFTMVLLAYAFLALRRLAGDEGVRPTIPQVARAIVLERGTQLLMRDHRLNRKRAKAYAFSVLKGVTDW